MQGIVINYNLYFKAIFREFISRYKETKNDISTRTIDAIALELVDNLQEEV